MELLVPVSGLQRDVAAQVPQTKDSGVCISSKREDNRDTNGT